MTALLTISLLALIISKVADIVSTVRGLRRAGGDLSWERNPLARWAFRRWGPGWGIAFVMLLWVMVVAACYGPAFGAAAWYQAATVTGGLLIAWAQWDVARMNATGRHSFFTRWMLARYRRW